MRHAAAVVEVWGHATGELDTPAKFESHRLELAQKVWKELGANDSAECRSCHTAGGHGFRNSSRRGGKRASISLAKNGTTCIDCHRGMAHTLPAGG